MTIKPVIMHLTEVILSNKDKSEKKIISKFLSTLDYLEGKDIPSYQEEAIMKFIESLNLKTYRGGNKKVIQRKLNKLNNYLIEEHSLIPEGYYMSNGMGFGTAFGLVIGISMAMTMGFEITAGLMVGLIIGMVTGMLAGIVLDETAKKKGKVIGVVSV